MTDFYIIDSGRPNIDYSGIDLAVITNSKIPTIIKTCSIDYDRNTGVDDDPTPNSTTDQKVSPITTQTPTLTVSFIIKRTDAAAMALLPYYDSLPQTKGTKLFFYGSTTDGWNSFLSALGAIYGADNHLALINAQMRSSVSSWPHMHVIVTRFSAKDDATGSNIKCTLNLRVTG